MVNGKPVTDFPVSHTAIWRRCNSEPLDMDSIIIRYKDNGSVRWEGLLRKSRKGTKTKERNWGPTDQRECNGEDKIACLESCRNTFRSKNSSTILACNTSKGPFSD